MDKISRLINKAAQLSEKGEHKEALEIIGQVEKTANDIKDDKIWYRIVYVKGGIMEYLGRFQDAIINFEFALIKAKKISEKNTKSLEYKFEVLDTLDSIARLFYKMGRPEDSKLRCQEILKICDNIHEENPENMSIKLRIVNTSANIGLLLISMGSPDEGLERCKSALVTYQELSEKEPSNLNWLHNTSCCFINIGCVFKQKKCYEEAKKYYVKALKIQEKISEIYPSPESQVDIVRYMNDLGNLLVDEGCFQEANTKYEEALQIGNKLLEQNPDNAVYQSVVGGILNDIGSLLSKVGQIDNSKRRYKQALQIYAEPMQYMSLKTKSNTIIQLVQLNLDCAEAETNSYKKILYLREAFSTCKEYKAFFEYYGLNHERSLVMEAGLRAFVEYSMIVIKEEGDLDKRIIEYNQSIQAVEKMEIIEADENIKRLLSSAACYLHGRKLVNESLKPEGLDIKLVEQAKEQFKNARNSYEKATLCYCIYTGLLELENIENLDEEAASKIDLIREIINELSDKTDSNVISVFEEIISLLENREDRNKERFLKKLNEKILRIDYYALRQLFGHTSEKLAEYLKEPFSANVEYVNWKLRIKFNDPSNIKGILTIKANDKIIFDEPIGSKTEIVIPYIPDLKKENITFKTSEKEKVIVRPIEYGEFIEGINACILEYDCSSSLVINNNILNIAVVQLKYEIIKEDNVIKLTTDNTRNISDKSKIQAIREKEEAYKKKIHLILETIKDKVKVVVFPEFSVPFEYLPEIQKYADSSRIIIVAGSHYVTEDHLEEYKELFSTEIEDKDLRKNICPIIIPSSDIVHSEKMFAAKLERELFNEEGMTSGELNRILKVNDNLTIGVLICFEYLKNNLKERLIETCDIILVPQANPGPKRFIDTAIDDINNPQYSGNKTYVMVNGIFPFEGRLSGGSSGLISTLDKYSNNKQIEEIKSIEGVFEQFVLIASIDTGFSPARDAANAQVPIKTQYIPIIEEGEIFYKTEIELQKDIDAIKRIYSSLEKQKELIDEKEIYAKENIQAFIDLLEKINFCDKNNLKMLLESNKELIKKYSPLMYEKNIKRLKNLTLDEIKSKCCIILVPKV